MADAATIGASFSDYQGNANLASGNFGVISVDTKPLDQLAQYTMLSNQVKWKQRQAETDAKVAQLADLSNISLNDLRGKDKEQASKEFTNLISYASEYARKQPKNNQERLKDELEWQTRYGAFKNNFNSGKGRAVSYYAHLNTIKQNITDATTQDEAIRQLNRTFDTTGIDTPISAVPNFKMEKFDLPTPVVSDVSMVAVEGNDTFITKGGVWVGGKNAPTADAAILDLSKVNIQKGSPEYNLLTQNEKDQADLQATVQSSGKGWLDAATPLNESIKKYVVDGVFNAQKFEEDNASNTTLMSAYNALKRMSVYSKQKKDEATAGIFNDSGVQVKLPQGIVPNDFNAGIVDFSNGINPTQLVMAGSFAKYEGDKFTKTVQHTGEKNDLLKARMIQEGENYRKKLDEQGANFRAKLPYEKAKVGTVDAAGNPIDFGNLIYGVQVKDPINISSDAGDKLKNVKIQNGTIVDKSGNPVNYTGDLKLPASYFDNSILVEYNKYVGGTKLDPTTGAVLANSSPTQLLNDHGKYHVSFENGEIQGIYAANENGQEKGSLVTVDQFKHITMQAAQKGVTKYKKADVNYGKVNSTQQTAPLTDAQKYLNSIKK